MICVAHLMHEQYSISLHSVTYHYLRQAGYVIVIVCLFVCLSVTNFQKKTSK